MTFSFGATPAAPAAPAAGGFSFGSPAPATPAAPAFGAPAPAQAPAPAPTPAFGAPAAAPATGFGGFGAAATPTAAPAFGAPAPAPAASGFGAFGAASPAPAPSAFGAFGATPAAAPAPSAFGGFGMTPAAAPAPPSAFGGFGSPAPATAAPATAAAGNSTIRPRTKYNNLPPQLRAHLDQLFEAKNKTGKGLSDISGVKIDPPGMGGRSSEEGEDGKDLSAGAEEKKEDPQGDSSLMDLVPVLTQISLSLQQQSAALGRIEQQTRAECQSVTKDGLWVMERVKDRRNIVAKIKGEEKLGGGGSQVSQKDGNMISLLPRNETVPPNYLWNLLANLEKEARHTEGNVNQLQKQMSEAIRRNVTGAGEEGGGQMVGDPRERIQTIITNNHKAFFRLAGRVSVNNSALAMKKKRILRGGYSTRNKAILKLQGGNGGDRLEKKLKEEMNKFRATQAQSQMINTGGTGGQQQQQQLQQPATTSAFGGFGQAKTAAATPAVGGFGGFGGGGFGAAPTPAAPAPSFGGFGAAPASSLQQQSGGFGGFNTVSSKKKGGKGKKR